VHYAVQVSGDFPVAPAGPVRGMAQHVRGGRRQLVVRDLAGTVPPGNRTVLGWTSAGRAGCSAFALTPLAVPTAAPQPATGYQPASMYGSARQLLAEWPLGEARPVGQWITNLRRARVPNLVGLVKLGGQTDHDTQRLSEECGLQHFEGRSFRGWHHHVTLVGAAHAYRLLREHTASGE
jgi:hypothetical protein